MKITVAVTCYNLQDRISACLESVIAQDYKDIEILVIDDCSTDKSMEVINTLIDLHSDREFRFIINEINIGLNRVRNLAIQEAKGDAIFFVDGDDTIEPYTISLFHRRMVETKVDVVCGSFQKKGLDGNTYFIKQFPEDTIKGTFAYLSYLERYINGYFNLGVWNNLYRLDFLRSHDIWNDTHYRIFEDRMFTFRVVLNAQSVSYLHDITYNYFDVPTSICHQNNSGSFLLTYRAIIESVMNEKRRFELDHQDIPFLWGLKFLLNYICLTDGLLKKSMESDASKKEKKSLLKWLKEEYKQNDLSWNNIVGPYNKISYLILISPFSYTLFFLYFNHLQVVRKLIVSLKLSNKYI